MAQMLLPPNTTPLAHQVAGHMFEAGKAAIGMLKHDNGTVLKACTKPLCGVREIQFYDDLYNDTSPSAAMLRELVPKYYGTRRLCLDVDRQVDFLVLSDVTQGMAEPCIMDVKIGRRTWDPLASPEKIRSEEAKYSACKHGLGVCIPGFQVTSVKTGKTRRYGKDYGKRLTPETIKDALRIYLNADAGLSRALLVQILSALWRILHWARTQRSLHLYSSSLLLAYDARRLRDDLQEDSISRLANLERALAHGVKGDCEEELLKVQHNGVMSGDHAEKRRSGLWAEVKMIDFAHAFPADSDGPDLNYLHGLQNLVKLFEDFLKEINQ